ncbi:MAG: lactate utilization protein C [Algoriphagus sp.]
MNSRESILQAIRKLPREKKNLPELPDFGKNSDLLAEFCQSITRNAGEVLSLEDFQEWMKEKNFKKVISLVPDYASLSTQAMPKDPHALDSLDLAIVEAQFGVAENGAMWLDETSLCHRVLPFIAEHLVIVLRSAHLFPTLHQAYAQLQDASTGFGVFVAGPSKTADIEQSLVIGAQGAKSLRVILVD